MLHNARNITQVGLVGDAAGKLLSKFVCAEHNCADAVRACLALPQCDTVEHQLPVERSVPKRRPRRPRPPQQPMARLRRSWNTWGVRNPKLQSEVARCQALANDARVVTPGNWLPKARRLAWLHNFCDEYCASSGESLPDLGRDLAPAEAQAPSGALHCPPADTKLLLITYQNGPSPWLW